MSREPRAERRRHLKAEVALSEPARDLIDAAFEGGKDSYEAIAAAILAATGEKIGKSSVARYWRFWRAKRRGDEARDAARRLIADLKDHPAPEIEAALEHLTAATIYQGLAEAEGAGINPADLIKAKVATGRLKLAEQKLDLDRERKGLQAQKLDLDRQLVGLETRKVELRERATQAAQRITEKVKTAMKELPPDVARIIDEEVYGLVS